MDDMVKHERPMRSKMMYVMVKHERPRRSKMMGDMVKHERPMRSKMHCSMKLPKAAAVRNSAVH